jgi:methylphosphotriester-DNA--protein-cysteine methyltransferase
MILLLTLLPLVLASAQEVPQELSRFLRDRIGFTDKELADLQRAEAVAKVLTSEQQEVAVFDQPTQPGAKFRPPLYFGPRGVQ